MLVSERGVLSPGRSRDVTVIWRSTSPSHSREMYVSTYWREWLTNCPGVERSAPLVVLESSIWIMVRWYGGMVVWRAVGVDVLAYA